MFTETDLMLIREGLLQKLNEDFKRFCSHSEENLKILKIVGKINLYMQVQV